MLSHSTWLLLATALEPEPGMCRAAFPKAYFDPTTKRCAVFTWGGCD
jgi:hypothetical protein